MARRRLQKSGYLYRDGNWWRLRWREDSRDTSGRIVRARPSAVIGPCKGAGAITKKQAERVAWDMILSKLDTFTIVPQSMMSLAQFVTQKFEPEYLSTLKYSGQLHYRYCFGKIIPVLGSLRLRDVTASAIYSLLSHLQQKYSTQTVAHVKNALSAIFEHAKSVGHFSGDNPARLVRLQQITHSERHALSFEKATAALQLLPSPVREMAYLSMTTSLNVAELCGLRWKRINLSDAAVVCGRDAIPPGALAVRENYYRNRWGTVKSGKRNRIVPMPTEAVSMLVAIKAGTQFSDAEDSVFAGRTGRPLDAHNINSRVFKALSKTLGVQITWHIFRHSCATFAEQVGMAKSDRIALMGHATGAMTDLYTHSDIERRRAGVNEISRRILDRMWAGAEGELQ